MGNRTIMPNVIASILGSDHWRAVGKASFVLMVDGGELPKSTERLLNQHCGGITVHCMTHCLYDEDDFLRAGALTARKVYMLAPELEDENDDGHVDEEDAQSADAQTIKSTILLRHMARERGITPNYINDLLSTQSILLLDRTGWWPATEDAWASAPLYASEHSKAAEELSTLVEGDEEDVALLRIPSL